MLRMVFVLGALAVAVPAAAQQAAQPSTAPAAAPPPAQAPATTTAPAEIVLMEAPVPPAYPNPESYAAAITSAVNQWVEAQRQLLEEQRAELDQRRALLDQEAALLEQQRALADRQAEIMPPDEVTIPEFFQGDAEFAEEYGTRPDAFHPGLDNRSFQPGPNLDTFAPGPPDTGSDFFTTEDPPESP